MKLGRDPVIVGPLGQALVEAVLQRQRGRLRACCRRATQGQPRGRVVIKFIVDRDGSVSSAGVEHSNLNEPEVERCLAQQIGGIRFPAPRGGNMATVSFPFVFSPG